MKDELISRQALYEKTAEWEAEALHMVDALRLYAGQAEYIKWFAILTERTAFKYDVADAPSAERRGKWLEYENDVFEKRWKCSACKRFTFHNGAMLKKYKYCPECGAKMERRIDDDET